MLLSSKTAQLKVENSAQTTFRFSPVSYRAPRVHPYNLDLHCCLGCGVSDTFFCLGSGKIRLSVQKLKNESTEQHGYSIIIARNTYRKGRISTVDLLILPSLYQLLYILKILFDSVSKRATLIGRSTVLNLPLQ